MLPEKLRDYITHPDRSKYDKYIKTHIEGKKVLDVGCVQHDAEAAESGGWMHGLISADADEVLGIDILQEELDALEQRGYKMIYADAQDFDLGEEFDVIFLGELLEHLSDFDGLFESITDHLAEDGHIIITTPNALSVYWSLLRTFRGPSINPEHTCWFDDQTLSQLLDRYEFEVTAVDYARMSRLYSVRSVFAAMGWLLERSLPDVIGHRNLVVVARSAE